MVTTRSTLADRLRQASDFTPGQAQASLAAQEEQDHEFVDENGDGECDVCGQPEEAHQGSGAQTAADAEEFAKGAKHEFEDKGDGECTKCGMPKEMHQGYDAETDTFKPYPWDQCIQDQLDKGYDEERAKKICGSIKAGAAANVTTLT